MMAFGRRFISRAILFIFIVLLVLSFLFMKSFESVSGKTQTNEAKDFNSEKAKKRTQVDIVVVEEHHEVLEYWFEAARKGIIPKSGNTLLHIDAHSDMAPPENVEDYPFFRYPENKVEIRAMMQSNDVFIQAAAMSGFFKKVIWVWPSWDEQSHDGDDMISFFGGGWIDVTIDGVSEKSFCECELKKDGVTKTLCQYVNRTALETDENYDGTKVDPKSCNLKGIIEYQEIAGYNALHKIIAGNLVKDGESLLLDIDQDYFGCVLRGQSLVNVGISWKDVEEIDDLLNEIVCPEKIEHEALGNDLMQMVLKLIIQKCKWSETSKACVTPKHPINKDFTRNLNQITKLFISKQMFCKLEKKNREKKLSLLVENFLRLSSKQLRALAKIGFCMQTTPRSYDSPGFQLCHGANEPNTTIVTVHMPEESEVKLRLARLRRIVEAKNYPTPGMVTLCRSVRDGYTPVSHFEDIEKNIIRFIQRSRPGVQYKAVYDVNLLGGKKGWPSREKNYNLPNQLTNINRRKLKEN